MITYLVSKKVGNCVIFVTRNRGRKPRGEQYWLTRFMWKIGS